MIKIIFVVLIVFVAVCCQNTTYKVNNHVFTTQTPPKTFPLNVHQGYTHNVLSREVIKPILNTQGTPLVTGKPILLKGKKAIVTSQKLENPLMAISHKPQPSKAVAIKQTRRYSVKKRLAHNTPHSLTNQLGNAVPAQQVIPVKMKRKHLQQPALVETNPLRPNPKAGYDIRHIDMQQDEMLGKVQAIAGNQDKSLWLATTRGLSHYNGVSFSHYTQQQGLPCGLIQSVIVDNQKQVWFTSRGQGIGKYDGDSLWILDDKRAILNDYIRCLAQDKQGNIWWGSRNVVTKYDGQGVTHFNVGKAGKNNMVNTIHEDHSGNMWIGTNQGIFCINGLQVSEYFVNEIDNLQVQAISSDAKGQVWLSSLNQGLLKYNKTFFTQYTTKQGGVRKKVTDLKTDDQGNIWISTRKGLIKFDGLDFIYFTTQEGLLDNSIMKISVGAQGALWLVNELGNVEKYQPRSFRFPNLKLPIKNTAITALHGKRQGSFWLAARDQGILQWTDSLITYHNHPALDSHNITYAILEDTQHNVWIGTTKGLFKYTQGKLTHYLANSFITSLCQDKRGNIWVGTLRHGLWQYNNNDWVQYTDQRGLLSNTIYTILEDHQGNLWLGSKQGLSKLKGQSITHYTEKEGLSGNNVRALFEDAQKKLWISTNTTGLMQFDGKKIVYYTQQEGLPSNRISSIAEDAQGRIWLSTFAGVACLKPHTHQTKSSFAQPVIYNDLKHVAFEQNSLYQDSNGSLYWGSSTGLVHLDVNQLGLEKRQTTKMALKTLRVNENQLDYRTLNNEWKQAIKFNKVARFANYPVNPTFSSNVNHLTFDFTTTGFAQIDKTYYIYRLKELETRWSKPTKHGIASYRNLPSGHYTFQVKARKNAQNWGEVFEYSFVITPPWWQTWWFKSSVFLCLSALVWLGHQQRLHLIKRQKIALEKLVGTKTQEIETKNKALLVAKERENEVLEKAMKSEIQRLIMLKDLLDTKHQDLKTLNKQLGKLSQVQRSPQLNQISINLRQLTTSYLDSMQLFDTIEAQYPQIFASVKTQYPQLSENDARHVLLVKLNYSPKEAAQLLGVSYNAVRMARTRLNKKLRVPNEVTLHEFINRAKI